jgi:hypothetical protein
MFTRRNNSNEVQFTPVGGTVRNGARDSVITVLMRLRVGMGPSNLYYSVMVVFEGSILQQLCCAAVLLLCNCHQA